MILAMTSANFVTLIRFCFIPLLIYVLTHQWFYMAVGVLIFSGLSDLLDGYLARRYHQITKLGMVLDPAADKLLLMSVYVYFLKEGLPMWFVLFTFFKDFSLPVGVLALVFYDKKALTSAAWIGKLSAGANLLLALFLCFAQSMIFLKEFIPLSVSVVFGTSLLSFFFYSYRWFRLFHGESV